MPTAKYTFSYDFARNMFNCCINNVRLLKGVVVWVTKIPN